MTPLSPPSPNLTSEGCWREEQVEDGACEEGTTSGPLLPGCSESSELGHPQGHPVRDSRAVQSRGKRPRWGRSTPPTHTHTPCERWGQQSSLQVRTALRPLKKHQCFPCLYPNECPAGCTPSSTMKLPRRGPHAHFELLIHCYFKTFSLSAKKCLCGVDSPH